MEYVTNLRHRTVVLRITRHRDLDPWDDRIPHMVPMIVETWELSIRKQVAVLSEK